MNSEKQPRILVCTVKAWNAMEGDSTFSQLLAEYPKSHIASLFIREEQPDSPVCERYFRICEARVMRSIFRRNEKTGYVVRDQDDSAEQKPAQYAHQKNFYYSKLFFRELIWKLGKWKTPELEQFIDEFAPDVLIYEMSRYIHLNHIVMYILQRTKAIGIGCFWDDTFTYKQEKSFGYKALRFFQRRNLKKLAKKTTTFFSITPKTKREADAFFGIQSTVLTKPVPQIPELKESSYTFPLRMLYTGNVGIGRLGALKLVAAELKKINADGLKLTLDVYTNTPIAEADKQLLNTEFFTLHPPVSQSEALALQQWADILLFVESLEADNKTARLSFSTKITDYYAAGKCIFAIGNEDLAPMELFAECDSAVTATNERELGCKLPLLLNRTLLTEYARKALIAGQSNHSAAHIRKIFYDGIISAYQQNTEAAQRRCTTVDVASLRESLA